LGIRDWGFDHLPDVTGELEEKGVKQFKDSCDSLLVLIKEKGESQ
jgi:hypothetical protein